MGKKNDVSRLPGGSPIRLSIYQLLNLLRRLLEDRVVSTLDCL
jgi:hypothetical protein